MSTPAVNRIRPAVASDAAQLLRMWSLVFSEQEFSEQNPDVRTRWKEHARDWFSRVVDDGMTACFPVIEFNGQILATAVGTLEIGVPNPECPRGRTVRLTNVITLAEYRGRGLGTLIVRHVVEWARSIDVDRVDLSATPAGQRIYETVGFTPTKAPRMKLVL